MGLLVHQGFVKARVGSLFFEPLVGDICEVAGLEFGKKGGSAEVHVIEGAHGEGEI